MTEQSAWVRMTQADPEHSAAYVQRFRTLAEQGMDLVGEARLVDAMLPRGSRVLDAGCGPGRVGGFLHEVGHQVVGVDVDPVLIAAAEEDHPGPRWLVGDLAELDLDEDPFDAAVVAGNVMVFLAPGTEAEVLSRLRTHVRRDGRIVVGFRLDTAYALELFDADIATSGLVLEQRFATWDLVPYAEGADFAVTLLRVP